VVAGSLEEKRVECEDEALPGCGGLFKSGAPNRSPQFVEGRCAKGEQTFGRINCQMIVEQWQISYLAQM